MTDLDIEDAPAGAADEPHGRRHDRDVTERTEVIPRGNLPEARRGTLDPHPGPAPAGPDVTERTRVIPRGGPGPAAQDGAAARPGPDQPEPAGGTPAGPGGAPGWARGEPAPNLFASGLLNSVTQTLDLTALRRRLAASEPPPGPATSGGTPRLYGPPDAAARQSANAEGTQLLYRTPARRRRRHAATGPQPATTGPRPAPGAAPAAGRPRGQPADVGLAPVDGSAEPPGPSGHGAPDDAQPLGSARSRALWTMIDQLISSGTNFLLMIVVARAVGDYEFGAFAVAFGVFSVVIGFSKAAGGQPLGIRYSGAGRAAFARAGAAATGTAVVLGTLVGLGCVAVGMAMDGAVGSCLTVLGVVLPGLLLQDLWRQTFFAQGRPKAAAINDTIWAVVQVGGIALLLARDVRLAAPMLFAWGAAAAVAALIGVVQAGFWPAPSRAGEWVREHRDINGYLAAEFITIQGALNAALLMIAAIGGVTLNGALRGVQSLLGPTTIFAIGLASWAIPEFSRRKDMSAAARIRAAYLMSAAVTAVSIVWGLGFLFLGPVKIGGTPIGEQLLGDTWAGTYDLLGLSIIQQAGSTATLGVGCMLIAMGRAKQTFRINAIMAPQLLLFPVIGVLLGDGTGTVIGFILANWVCVPLWYRLLGRAAREAEREWKDQQRGPGRDRGAGEGAPAAARQPVE